MENLNESNLSYLQNYGPIPNDLIKNKKLKFSCNIFNLYEGVYNKDKEVLILQFKFLDPFFNTESIREDNFDESFINVADQFQINQLKNIGYHYDENENLLYLIYLKEKNKLFDFKEFLKTVKNRNVKLVKMQIFYDIIKIVDRLQEKGRKLSLLHPQLLIMTKDKHIGLIDVFLDDVISQVDKFKNFQICNYFGYFDLNAFEDIDDAEIENNELYYKTDTVILSILLVYLFSTKFNEENQQEDFLNVTYEKILYELQREFFLQSTTFSNFLSTINDETIINFLKDNMSLNYSRLLSIKEYKKNFEQLLIRQYQEVKCIDCKMADEEENEGEMKHINFKCFEVICTKCFKNKRHNCKETRDTNRETLLEKYNDYSSRIKSLSDIVDQIPQFEEKQLIDFYRHNLKAVFDSISEEHLDIERKIKMEEEKLNCILQYVENMLDKKCKEVSESISQSLTNFNEVVTRVNYQIEKIKKGENTVLSIRNKKKMKDNFRKATTVNFEEKEGSSLAKQEKIEKLLNEENLKDIVSSLEDSVKKYELFVNSTHEFKSGINYNSKISEALELIKAKTVKYIEEINKNFNQDFTDSLTYITEETSKLVKSNASSEDLIIKESSFLNPHHDVIATVSSDKNKVFFIFDPKKFETCKIIFPEESKRSSFINKILPHCRYVNMKTRLFITGGLDDKEVYSKSAFFIEYASKTQNERKAYLLPDMLTGRDQHSMIQINDFNIWCIGGSQTNKCEMFDFVKTKWIEKPSLNKNRYNSSLFLRDDCELYVFFGLRTDKSSRNHFDYNEDIERLTLYSSKPNWELLKVNFDDDIKSKQFSLAGVLPNDKEIILLGGKTNNEQDYSHNFYRFSFDDMKLSLLNNRKVSQKISFPFSTFVKWRLNNNGKSKLQWAAYTSELVLYAIDVVE